MYVRQGLLLVVLLRLLLLLLVVVLNFLVVPVFLSTFSRFHCSALCLLRNEQLNLGLHSGVHD